MKGEYSLPAAYLPAYCSLAGGPETPAEWGAGAPVAMLLPTAAQHSRPAGRPALSRRGAARELGAIHACTRLLESRRARGATRAECFHCTLPTGVSSAG